MISKKIKTSLFLSIMLLFISAMFVLFANTISLADENEPQPITTRAELEAAFSNGGDYYLENDIVLNGSELIFNSPGITVNLDLRDSDLDAEHSSRVLSLLAGTLVLYSNSTVQPGEMGIGQLKDGNSAKKDDLYCAGGGVYVDGGNLVMNGGTIAECRSYLSNQNAGDGGCIHLESGSVKINDGQLVSGQAVRGGGVCVNGGEFEFNGGLISNCVANTERYSATDKKSWSAGGGIAIVNPEAKAKMTGGEIR